MEQNIKSSENSPDKSFKTSGAGQQPKEPENSPNNPQPDSSGQEGTSPETLSEESFPSTPPHEPLIMENPPKLQRIQPMDSAPFSGDNCLHPQAIPISNALRISHVF